MHLDIKIYGRVQGVFFRTSSASKAKELNITGFVRNNTDDSVYIEAEGDRRDLDEFVGWCKHGPRFAKVEKVEVTEGATQGFPGFLII
jgi:acylphosphatase